jgi:hypothetical protein
MVRRQPLYPPIAAALLIFAGTSDAAVLNEIGAGGTISFSSDRLAPTPFVLDYIQCNNGDVGCNILTGQFGRDAAGVVDLDYIRLVVPDGYALSQIIVGNQTTVGGSTAFIGLASGPTMPLPNDATSAAGLLGWRHFGNADRTTNILDDMAVSGAGATGFTTPLPAGDYTIWLQELASGGPYTYRLNFMVTPVPLPAAVWMFGSALFGLAWFRRRTQRT